MDEKEIKWLFIVLTIIAIIIATVLVTLFILFQKRKNHLILKQKEAEKHFEQEISKMQIEIREETFRSLSWELHDNIGQLITLAKIQLQNAASKAEIKESLDACLKEVRALSKAINPEALKEIALTEAISQEIHRFNKLKFIKAELNVQGEEKKLDPKAEIVFFRILQEFFSNTIKHANATQLKIFVTFGKNELNITAEDNGKGFNSNEQTKSHGIGLKNITKRAQLINAKAEVKSEVGVGTRLHIFYNIN